MTACACFTSKLQSSSAGQEEENEAVFICVCECHVGAANDMAVREGPRVYQHLRTTRTGLLPAGPAEGSSTGGTYQTGTLQFHSL